MARNTEDANLPPLSALFVNCFDQRRGNSIVWQRTSDGSELDDSLAFKAIPSQLHNLKSDIIYFVHQDQAGVSAFENVLDSTVRRGASFYALAALTPRNGTRLGKVWLHASRLLSILQETMAEDSQEQPDPDGPKLGPRAVEKLDQYWVTASNPPRDEASSPSTRRGRRRAPSEALPSTASLENHPASSVSLLLDSFGPLLFPLYRQALLRRRILIVRKPPMQPLCHFIYLISILSGLPASIAEDRSVTTPSQELEPLFSICIHDITELESRRKGVDVNSWVAATSDELLATKPQLFDVKVEFPTPDNETASRRWPSITTSDGAYIKATQRDLRHYRALRTRINATYEPVEPTDVDQGAQDPEVNFSADETSLLLGQDEPDPQAAAPSTYPIPSESSISEPAPWAAIAYDSFIWWASAGERDADFQSERDFDADLLDAAFALRPHSPATRRPSMSMSGTSQVGESFEMSIVAYFQRLTAIMLQRLIEAVPGRVRGAVASDSDDGGSSASGAEGEAGVEGFVTKDDLIKMGLDVWSKSDRDFVQKFARLYLGAEVEVQGKSVECCGVRIL